MAIVYADFSELESFQSNISDIIPSLEEQSTSMENFITSATTQIDEGIIFAQKQQIKAEENLKQAQTDYIQATDMLSLEQNRINNLNNNRDADTPPYEVAEFYYDRVDDARFSLDLAQSGYDRAVERVRRDYQIKEDFGLYVKQYRQNQIDEVETFKTLIKQSGAHLTRYIETLQQAKNVLINKSQEDNSEDILVNREINTRLLTEKEALSLSNKLGWSLKIISQKCTISMDSVIHYKTINVSMEGKAHKCGVYYQREQVSIQGIVVEGVFPVFNALFEPPIMSEELQKSDKYTKQFDYCNQELKNAVLTDKSLAGQFSKVQLSQIMDGKTPAGYTWHHHQQPGRMQLARKKEHNAAMQGAAHTGGGALWCCIGGKEL